MRHLLTAAQLEAAQAMAFASGVDLMPGTLRVANAASERAEVFVYGDIGGHWDGVDAKEFAKELAAITAPEILVRINSPGGFVSDGLAIYQSLAQHKAKVVTSVEGLCASIATVIAMAGDERKISQGSRFMIHKPWTISMGDADDFRREAEVLDLTEAGIIDVLEARSGAARSDIQAWMRAETWYSADGALSAGWVDEIIPAKGASNKLRSGIINRFRNAPADLLEQHNNTPDIRAFESFLNKGEGLSTAQAKRIASAAARALSLTRRDGDEGQQPTTLRDEGANGAVVASLSGLAETIRNAAI